jgi:hypothetical protein
MIMKTHRQDGTTAESMMSTQAKSQVLHAARRRVAMLATLLLGGAALLVATSARAQAVPQSLPVTVQASGDTATIEVKLGTEVLADLTLSFDDASGLSPSSLGVTAQLVSPTATSLLNRLPDGQLTQVPAALPLLVTIEPPANGGLSFDRSVRVEVHTHLLAYSTGSSFRLFKAPLGGAFRDITDEVAPGSVRARGTTGGFSQFLVLADVRETGDVVDTKVAWLRDRIDDLPSAEQGAFDAYLDTVESSVASEDYANAIAALDLFRARAASRAGNQLDATWTPAGQSGNDAGELIAGAATLKFSVAYLRDFGQ